MTGNVTYSQTGSTVVLNVDAIQNNSATASGSLRLDLVGFYTPFTGAAQGGFLLATYDLPSTLNGGASITNVSSGSVSFQFPGAGVWYFSLVLMENNGAAYLVDSFYSFPSPVVCSTTTCGTGNMMTNQGGPVQHGQKIYTIFWNPPGTSFPNGYQSTVNQFIHDLNGSSYYAVTTQYGDSAGQVSPQVSLAATWVDTSTALPSSPPSVQSILYEAVGAVLANGWTIDDNSLFLVYTPSDITGGGYCGYHSVAVNNSTGQHLAFGLILFPQAQSNGITCLKYPGPWPNGQAVDHAIDETAHEVAETVTDPFGTAWYLINLYGEIGDLCAGQTGPRDGFGSNLQLNGHRYLAQMLWSNAVSSCAISYAASPNPVASLSTNSLTFGTQVVGTSSASQNVMLTNSGKAALTITNINVGGNNPSDFIETNNCGSSVAAGSSCALNVVFNPATAGSRTASVTISDNATGSPQTITLSGTASSAGPAASLSTTTLSFGNQATGTSSNAQTVTLTNNGGAALTITGISIGGINTGDFSQTNNCAGALTVNSSCVISVSFKPTAAGSRSATVAITDNAPGSPQQVTLTGTGTSTQSTGSTANTYHVFPQLADGYFGDGSYFQSTVVVTNSNPGGGSSSCTLQFHGVTVSGQSQISFSVGGVYIYVTPGNTQALQTGYASLQCSSKVEAQLLYSFYASNGAKVSEATVFSSPPATSLRIIADYRGGSRLGLAIANDSTQTGNYTVRISDTNGNVLGSPTITVAAGQNHAAFVDELITLPNHYFGTVDVIANAGAASVIGLSFTGNAFTTIPAAILSSTSATANTYHVFPQVADGYFGDGSYFQSTVVVTNSNPGGGSSNCTLQFHSVTVNGQSQISFSVGGIYSYVTPGNTQALQTGYASLQCSSKVEAQLLYSFYSANGTKVSEATVFSSPSAASLRIVADYRGGSRLGLAIANDTTQIGNYMIRVSDTNGNVLGSPTITIAAGQNHAAFVDELATLPNNYYGFIDVIANTGSASVIGLSFSGNAFTTIPASVVGP